MSEKGRTVSVGSGALLGAFSFLLIVPLIKALLGIAGNQWILASRQELQLRFGLRRPGVRESPGALPR